MMLKIAYLAMTMSSYERAEEILKEMLNVKIGDDTIRNIVNFIGKIVYENDCNQTCQNINYYNTIANSPNKKCGVLYLETDGNFINIRNNNNKGSNWKENKIGVSFTSDDIIRWKNVNGEICQKIGKREYISHFCSADEFRSHLFALAIRNGYGCYETTILISDGAEWIKNFRKEYIPDAIHILDFFHLLDNASKFIKYINESANVFSDITLNNWKELFINSQYREVLEEIDKYKGMQCRDGVVNLYRYITNNIESIDYKTYIKNEYYIGSGCVESANKSVIQKRLKQSGMRWKRQNAQYVATLRAKIESNLWKSEVEKIVKKYFVNSKTVS